MRRTTLLSTALLAVAMISTPAWAQVNNADTDSEARGSANVQTSDEASSPRRFQDEYDARGETRANARTEARMNRNDRTESRQGQERQRQARRNENTRNQNNVEFRSDDRRDNRADRTADTELNLNSLELDARGNDVRVRSVTEGTVWNDSGLQQGDVIRTINRQPVRNAREFRQYVNDIARFERIPLEVMRNGRRQTIWISGNTPYERRSTSQQAENRSRASQEAWLGVLLNPRYDRQAIVSSVQSGSAADQAGLKEGDWIRSVNGQRVQNATHLSQLISSMDPNQQIEIGIAQLQTKTISATLDAQPQSRGRFRYETEERNRQARGNANVTNRANPRFQDRSDNRGQARTDGDLQTRLRSRQDFNDSDYDSGAVNRTRARFDRDRD